jgi:CheY-like chemotaxis protein
VPIFGLTTGRDDEELARCQASGMDGQLSKPVDISELRRLVNEMMGVTAS